jgi:hypothetical protein
VLISEGIWETLERHAESVHHFVVRKNKTVEFPGSAGCQLQEPSGLEDLIIVSASSKNSNGAFETLDKLKGILNETGTWLALNKIWIVPHTELKLHTSTVV